MKTQNSFGTTTNPNTLAWCLRTACATRLLSLLLLLSVLTVRADQYGDFTYSTDGTNVTITGYTGSGGVVTIPDTIDGLSVTGLGEEAFYNTPLTSVTIPASVTNIGDLAFGYCSGLTAITVDTNNPAYSSVAGVLFDKSTNTLIQCPEGKAGNFTVPDSVTNIGWYAFESCTSLTNITIGNSVTSIGDYAFDYCASLTSVTIPDSVTSIGVSAFDACISLSSVMIGKSVITIGNYAFESTGLTNVTIPNSVTSIGDYAFFYCTSLASVTIGSSVTNVGTFGFINCSSLMTITVDTNNPAFSSVSGVLFNQNQTTLVQCPEGLTGSYTVPNSVTNIGWYAFESCTSLTNITIGNSVTSIGGWAFESCTRLSSVTIPDSVISIGNGAFCYCASLTSITIGNSVTSIGFEAFDTCTSLKVVCFKGNAPSIGQYVFYGDNNATVYYLSGTTGWGSTFGGRPTAVWWLVPFNYTTNQNTIIITGYIGFGGAVTIPGTINNRPVTSIAGGAFQGCTTMTSIAIPDTVTNIGDWAFDYCSGLTAITVDALNPFYSSADGVLFDKSTNTLIQCPEGKAGNYFVPDSVTNIGPAAFALCTDLTSVTIANSVLSIGEDAFDSCYGLTNVAIPDSVISIGDWTFDYCTNLTSVTIGNGVTSIGEQAFSDCTSLTSIAIPASVTNIGDWTFGYCSSLTAITVDALNSVYSSADGILFNKNQTTLIQCPEGKTGSCTLPGTLVNIGDSAFEECSKLTSVIIPAGVTNLGYGTFYDCVNLTNVNIPAGVTAIWNYDFYNCASLTSITIPNSVTSIGEEAFRECASLTSVSIPDSVTGIAREAFDFCANLTSVTIGNGVTSFGWYVFYSCPNLTGIYFKGNAPGIGGYVFEGDSKATVYYLPGMTGWSSTFGGRPAVLWNPQAQTSDASFGVQTNQFGFNIVGTTNIPIVVEACTNLANPAWVPLQSCTLTNGSLYFSDPAWANYPGRFYHIRWP